MVILELYEHKFREQVGQIRSVRLLLELHLSTCLRIFCFRFERLDVRHVSVRLMSWIGFPLNGDIENR